MGTRGLYGFRKNNEDKTTYNHFDSYPTGLGADILRFIQDHSIAEMNDFYDDIILVDEHAKPTNKEKGHCLINEGVDLSVSNQSYDDWYCLLRNVQGNLEELFRWDSPCYMIDNRDFIKDSLFCEFAYIINLDTNMLEYYLGFQKTPQEENRYGMEVDSGYYPCKLISEIPLELIRKTADVMDIISEFMHESEEEE